MTEQPLLRLLYVEDNPADADALTETLDLHGKARRFDLAVEQRLESALLRLVGEDFHAMLLDLNLPDSQGLDTVSKVREIAPNLPILAMTGLYDEDLALQAVQAGVQDYLVKGQVTPDLLERAIRYAVERKRIDLALQHRAEELEGLYRTSLEINAEMSLATVLRSIIERAGDLLDTPSGGLFLIDSDGQHLRLVVGYGLMESYIGTILPVGDGLSGLVAQTKESAYVEDYMNWDKAAWPFKSGGFRRSLAIPLQVGDRVTGVIDLIDDEKVGPFSEDDLRLARLFADQAAIAVEKTRLYEAERLQSEELRRSNQLIAALSEMVSSLQTTYDAEQVMRTVGNELGKLGVHLLIARPDGSDGYMVTRYCSLNAEELAAVEAREGFALSGIHVGERTGHPRALLELRRPAFRSNIVPMFSRMLTGAPAAAVQNLLRSAGVTERTHAIQLPLVEKDRLVGELLVWGEDLRESDLPAYNVFANQVAAALENARLYNEIQKLAIMDELTGLYNRRGFFTLAQQHIHLAQRSNKNVLLVFADIDGMKEINDTLGHTMGDQALIDAANILRQSYRMADIIARMGGDEFAVMATVGETPETSSLNERLVDQLDRFNATHQRPYRLSLSIGRSIWSTGKIAMLDNLITEADARMYAEKRTKKENRL